MVGQVTLFLSEEGFHPLCAIKTNHRQYLIQRAFIKYAENNPIGRFFKFKRIGIDVPKCAFRNVRCCRQGNTGRCPQIYTMRCEKRRLKVEGEKLKVGTPSAPLAKRRGGCGPLDPKFMKSGEALSRSDDVFGLWPMRFIFRFQAYHQSLENEFPLPAFVLNLEPISTKPKDQTQIAS